MKEKILKAFLYNNKLKFNEIEKIVKSRSNKLAYHIKNLVNKGILIKNNQTYKLSETSETIIPYLKDKQAILPIILIAITHKNKIFLIKRQKRPYKDKLSLPGGRILLGETIPQATQRIMKEKYNIKIKLTKINSISLEHVKKNSKILHSFLLILITATTKQKIVYTNPKNNKSKIISSDYKLINQDLNKELKIKKIISKA